MTETQYTVVPQHSPRYAGLTAMVLGRDVTHTRVSVQIMQPGGRMVTRYVRFRTVANPEAAAPNLLSAAERALEAAYAAGTDVKGMAFALGRIETILASAILRAKG